MFILCFNKIGHSENDRSGMVTIFIVTVNFLFRIRQEGIQCLAKSLLICLVAILTLSVLTPAIKPTRMSNYTPGPHIL